MRSIDSRLGLRILPGLSLILLVAALGLSACEDKKEDKLVMAYGREWSTEAYEFTAGLALPPETRICVVTGYDEGLSSKMPLIRQSGLNGAALRIVEVNSPEAPVALLLLNHSATLWQIKSTPGTEVLAAATGGHWPQAISGLKPEAAVLIERGNKGRYFTQTYQRTSLQRQAVNNSARKYFGREADVIADSIDGTAVCGWSPSPDIELVSHSVFKTEKYDAGASVQARLDQALKSGWIRRAKRADLAAFKKARAMEGRLFVHEDALELLSDAYVVESRSFAFPAELEQLSDSAPGRFFTFFISPGLAFPEGPVANASIRFLEDGACLGRACGLTRAVYSASGRSPESLNFKLPPEQRFGDLKLPEKAVIYVGGAVKGQKTGKKDPKGKLDIGRLEVTVNSPGRPVALILSAHDPAEWHFDIKPGTKVAAVFLSGIYPQKLMNLPSDIPAVNAAEDEQRGLRFDFTSAHFKRINLLSENLFGRRPDRAFRSNDGSLLIDPSLPPQKPEPAAPQKTPKEPDNPAIKKALAQGLIRPASSGIRNAWFKKHMEYVGADNLMEPADFVYAPQFPTYEVMSEDLVFTDQMAGRGKVGFFLPENINLSIGDPGKATFYLMDDGACLGGGMSSPFHCHSWGYTKNRP